MPNSSEEFNSNEAQEKEVFIEYNSFSLASEKHPDRNEDAHFKDPEHQNYGVFDGVGGRAGGSIASSVVAEFMEAQMAKLNTAMTARESGAKIAELLTQADTLVRKFHKEQPEYSEAATTASIVHIHKTENGTAAVIVNAGDSRVYLRRESEIPPFRLITLDDGIVREKYGNTDEARKVQITLDNCEDKGQLSSDLYELYSRRNRIYNGVGSVEQGVVKPRIQVINLEEGDLILITSDGVHDNLTREEMDNATRNLRKADVSKSLVQTAFRVQTPRHKSDDITAIAINVSFQRPTKDIRLEKPLTETTKVYNHPAVEKLFTYIDTLGSIQGTQKDFKPDEIKRLVEDTLNGDRNITAITRSFELRDKVKELVTRRSTLLQDLEEGRYVFDKHNSLETLLEDLDLINGVQGSSRKFTFEELQELIDEIKLGNRQLTALPRTGNLRGTVERLLQR